MVLILINQIDIEFFRLKLTLELIGLVQSLIELIFTSHVLSSPKELFDHLWVNFSFQDLFDLARAVPTLHKARVTPGGLEHLGGDLVKFFAA